MADYNLTNNAADIDQALQDAKELLPASRGYVLWDSNTLVKQTSETDTSAGAVLLNRAFGLGAPSGSALDIVGADLDTLKDQLFAHLSAPINSPSSGNGYIQVFPSTGTTFTKQTFTSTTSGVIFERYEASGTWSAWRTNLDTGNLPATPLTTAIAPNADNTISSGTAALRFSQVFAANGTINTSDAREKTNLRTLNNDEINCAKELSKEIGVYQWVSSVNEKGDAARLHIGMTVQKAIEVFERNNLDPMRYGIICYDEWQDEFEKIPVIDSDGKETGEYKDGKKIQSAGNRYGFRYEQLNQFIISGVVARLESIEV